MKVSPACILVCYIIAVSLVISGSATMSKTQLDCLCTVNGDANNSAEIQAGVQGIVPVSARFIPVIVPAIERDIPCLYGEQIVNGKTYRAAVFKVILDKEGYFQFHEYNVTEAFQFTPGTYDVTRLASLKTEDLPPYPATCEGTYKPVASGFYVGSVTDCKKKDHPLYSETLTCKAIFFTPSKESVETQEQEPYQLPFTRKYPIPGAPDNFACDCLQKT